jgi:hypothetical protein
MPGSRGNSSVGRARPCQGRGREFESRFPLQFSDKTSGNPGFCFLYFTPVSWRRLLFGWPGGRVVMQRPAKPRTPVRFRPWPPSDILAPGHERGENSEDHGRTFQSSARVAKSVDARDLKSLDPNRSCRFESGPGHTPLRTRARSLLMPAGHARRQEASLSCRMIKSRRRVPQLPRSSCTHKQRGKGQVSSYSGRIAAPISAGAIALATMRQHGAHENKAASDGY